MAHISFLLELLALAVIGALHVCNAQFNNDLQQSLCRGNRWGFRSAKNIGHLKSTERVKRDAPGTCPAVPTQSITDHFKSWLNANGFGQYDFSTNGCGRAGSFGGRVNQNDSPSAGKRPVIFIHGAIDGVMGRGNTTGDARNCGWSQVLNHFMQQGYKMSDLYALTWGANNPLQVSTLSYSGMYTDRISKFIQAVLSYTGASKVDVIGHSMGVPLGRAAIAGQHGPNLSSRVENFIGIAGANGGFTTGTKIANNVFSICTPGDQIIDMQSCAVPGQKCSMVLQGLTHLSVRSTTAVQQLNLLRTGQC